MFEINHFIPVFPIIIFFIWILNFGMMVKCSRDFMFYQYFEIVLTLGNNEYFKK